MLCSVHGTSEDSRALVCIVTKSAIYRTGCIRTTDIWCQTLII